MNILTVSSTKFLLKRILFDVFTYGIVTLFSYSILKIYQNPWLKEQRTLIRRLKSEKGSKYPEKFALIIEELNKVLLTKVFCFDLSNLITLLKR